MHSDGLVLLITGGIGCLLGLAAMLADVSGVGAVLWGLVFSLAALCLFAGWRFWSAPQVERFHEREHGHD